VSANYKNDENTLGAEVDVKIGFWLSNYQVNKRYTSQFKSITQNNIVTVLKARWNRNKCSVK
jgi:hypothetical protein